MEQNKKNYYKALFLGVKSRYKIYNIRILGETFVKNNRNTGGQNAQEPKIILRNI